MILFQKNKPTTTDIGRHGEEVAVRFLKKKGFRVIARNVRAGRNEIDIVAEDKSFLIFVEVKTRSGVGSYEYDYGSPATAVTHAKRKRTIEAARAYLYKNPSQKEPRFDVIEVYLGNTAFTLSPEVQKIEHIEDAFRD